MTGVNSPACVDRRVCIHVYLGILNRATLVSELVERGEKMLQDGLRLPNSNPSNLNDTICAQLCVAGLEALGRATRYDSFFTGKLLYVNLLYACVSEWPFDCWKKMFYFLGSSSHIVSFYFFVVISLWFCRFCSEKSPEAIRILLPDETSPAVSPLKNMI